MISERPIELLLQLVLYLPVLLVSVALHEYAHARTAVGQGDPTPARQGRVTLNPLVHIDPVGSVLVPIGLWLFSGGSWVFGWAKPVQVNPGNYRDTRRGDLLVSSAGVAANFLLAVAFTLIMVPLLRLGRGSAQLSGLLALGAQMADFGIRLNLLLAVFNLLPVPPLDGSHLLYHALPRNLAVRYRELSRYGVLLFVLVLMVPGLLRILLWPVWVFYDLSQRFVGAWV